MSDDNRAKQNAIACAEGIADLYAVWRFSQEEITGSELTLGQKRFLRELMGGDWDGEGFSDLADAVTDRVREDPLSVEVRSDWRTPGEVSDPSEFCILLTTGGPACRILGSLNRYKEPSSACVQYQDWFKPWEDLHTRHYDEDALLWYAGQFYYGEG